MSLSHFRGFLFAFSTAAQQRSTGDDCGPDDPHDEPRHLLNENTVEEKAIKLEEQIRVLTVSTTVVLREVPCLKYSFGLAHY